MVIAWTPLKQRLLFQSSLLRTGPGLGKCSLMGPVCVTFQGKLKTRYLCELSQFLNGHNQFCFLKVPCKPHTIHLSISPVSVLLVCNLSLRGVSQRPNNGGPGCSGVPGIGYCGGHTCEPSGSGRVELLETWQGYARRGQ